MYMRRCHLPVMEVLCFVFAMATVPLFSNGDLGSDVEGLLSLKASVDRRDILQWSNTTSSNVCQWRGITCSGSTPRVTALRLPGLGLFGPIPRRSIGRLTELRVISLRFNRLSGSLPADLSNCRFMRSVYLRSNELSANIPSDFRIWPNLVHVDLSENDFNGSLPASLSNLTHLKSLYLENNSFSGSIPPLQIRTLTKFSVAYNRLTGRIPNTPTLRLFNSSAFMGNNLCGAPLPACFVEVPTPSAALVLSKSGRRKKLTGGVIAGIFISGIFLLVLLALLCLFLLRKCKSEKQMRRNAYGGTTAETSIGEGALPKRDVLPAEASSNENLNRLVFFEGSKYVFDLEDLLQASAEVLGKGSVGTAYKALLENGAIVAVKRLKDVTIDRKDFELHIVTIGRLKHPHLVPLIAYYYSKDEKLLVYEYVTNGSLSALLHGNKGVHRTPLDWNIRIRIAIESAEAINYLHDHSSIHGNIKSSNILLTKNYSSCVSDHGLAHLLSATAAASRIVGYKAPEVTDLRKITPQADVYSFGVLLLELLTGKAPSQASTGDEGIDLPQWVQTVVREEWTAEVFDTELMKYQDIEEEMVRMLQIAMVCISPSPDERPAMNEVVMMLEEMKKQSGKRPSGHSSSSGAAHADAGQLPKSEDIKVKK